MSTKTWHEMPASAYFTLLDEMCGVRIGQATASPISVPHGRPYVEVSLYADFR